MEQQFFCDPLGPGGRSPIVPVSVHQLRPGDIDVIGAIGDSLTAGNGALATNVLQVLIENKGVSWSIGGQGTWHRFLTLPNILKVFNPQLYGFSLSDGFSTDKSSRLVVLLRIKNRKTITEKLARGQYQVLLMRLLYVQVHHPLAPRYAILSRRYGMKTTTRRKNGYEFTANHIRNATPPINRDLCA